MNSTNNLQEFLSACRAVLAKFFDTFPDEAFQSITLQCLEKVQAEGHRRDGNPGGWAAALASMPAHPDKRCSHFK